MHLHEFKEKRQIWYHTLYVTFTWTIFLDLKEIIYM